MVRHIVTALFLVFPAALGAVSLQSGAGDPVPVPQACPSIGTPATTTTVITGSGSTRTAAYLDMITDGIDSALLAKSGVVCEVPCEEFVNSSGNVSGIHYMVIRNPATGEIVWWICIATWTGTYRVDCVD